MKISKNPVIGAKMLQLAIFMLIFLLPGFLFGQTGLEGSLTTVKDWIVGIVNVVFVIAIIIGLVRTFIAFISGNANAVRYLVYLIIAVLIWFAFSVLIDDFSSLGGIDNIG